VLSNYAALLPCLAQACCWSTRCTLAAPSWPTTDTALEQAFHDNRRAWRADPASHGAENSCRRSVRQLPNAVGTIAPVHPAVPPAGRGADGTAADPVSYTHLLPEARATQVGTTSDINPRDPATLRDGGNLRLPLGSFPDNFNELNIDGNTADTGDIVSPTLPGAFITQADGTLKLNTDYFTGAELTSTNPQVVTYTINPKATWNDGTPLTWEDLKSCLLYTSRCV